MKRLDGRRMRLSVLCGSYNLHEIFKHKLHSVLNFLGQLDVSVGGAGRLQSFAAVSHLHLFPKANLL